MTDTGQPRGVAGPPWSVDLLADLQAGALDDAQAAELWPQVRADPEAMAVITALEATQADLAALADAPAEPMPAHVAARLDATLAAEAAPAAHQAASATPVGPQAQSLAPVVDLGAARRKRNQRMGWGLGVVAAAAAAVAVVALVSPGATTDGTPMAGGERNGDAAPTEPAPGGAPLNVSPSNPEAAFGAVNGMQDYGPLGEREGLDECLQAHDIPTTGNTAGIRPGKVDGKDAVVAVLTTGEFATYRVIAVSPDCGPDNPGTVYIDEKVGRGGN